MPTKLPTHEDLSRSVDQPDNFIRLTILIMINHPKRMIRERAFMLIHDASILIAEMRMEEEGGGI